jgi:hypothetical protein
MELRRMTEERMRELFIASGGEPERSSPHYFVLGSSQWFRQLTPDTRSIELPISALPPGQTSVTYPDSFTAMEFGPKFGLPQEQKRYHGKVFRLEHLDDLVREYGLPKDEADITYDGYQHRPFEKYVEVQVWTDEPVRKYMG